MKADEIDRYLRRGNTLLAVTLRLLVPYRGERYTSSRAKRLLDLVLGLPVAAIGLPVAGMLALVNAVFHPSLPVLFVQDRVGQKGMVRILKLRSMLPRPANSTAPAHLHEAHRVTSFGRFIRRFYLDELPQLPLVLQGTLSLVGIRVLPVPVYEHLHECWSPGRFERWSRAYHASRLGLTGMHQVYRSKGKEDIQRFHRDVFYSTHASLGFDLYLLWRTLYRVAERWWNW